MEIHFRARDNLDALEYLIASLRVKSAGLGLETELYRLDKLEQAVRALYAEARD